MGALTPSPFFTSEDFAPVLRFPETATGSAQMPMRVELGTTEVEKRVERCDYQGRRRAERPWRVKGDGWERGSRRRGQMKMVKRAGDLNFFESGKFYSEMALRDPQKLPQQITPYEGFIEPRSHRNVLSGLRWQVVFSPADSADKQGG